MGAGPGFEDAQGVWQYGEDDAETLMSDLLNIGQQSVSDALVLDRSRLDTLEDDTGWITPVLLLGWSSVAGQTVQYRRRNGFVRARGQLTGGTTGVVFMLQSGCRPGQLEWHGVMSGTNATVALARVSVGADGSVGVVAGQQPNLSDIPTFVAEG